MHFTVSPVSSTAVEVRFGLDPGEDPPDSVIFNEYDVLGTQIGSSGNLPPLAGVGLFNGLQPDTQYCYQICTVKEGVAGGMDACGAWNQECTQTLQASQPAPPAPTRDFLQLFWRGTDDHLYTNWQDPATGTWQPSSQYLGGLLKGTPTVAPIPGTPVIQVFYRGTDNAVWSRWRDPDGTWSNEQRIGGILNGDPVAATLPGVDDVIQLFYPGLDNSIWSRWRLSSPTGDFWSGYNYWSDEQQIVSEPTTGNPIASAMPGLDYVIQLFYRDRSDTLRTRWRSPDGSWPAEQVLGPRLDSDPVAAHVPGGILQLFYASATDEDAIHSIWRDQDGSWQLKEQSLGGKGLTLAAALVPGTAKLIVVYVGPRNQLHSRLRDPANPGYWSVETPLPGEHWVNLGCGLMATDRPGENVVDIFYRDPGNNLMTRAYKADGSWSDPIAIASELNSNMAAAVIGG